MKFELLGVSRPLSAGASYRKTTNPLIPWRVHWCNEPMNITFPKRSIFLKKRDIVIYILISLQSYKHGNADKKLVEIVHDSESQANDDDQWLILRDRRQTCPHIIIQYYISTQTKKSCEREPKIAHKNLLHQQAKGTRPARSTEAKVRISK